MSLESLKRIFGTYKPIVAMCHLDPLPGDPKYDKSKGMDYVIDRAHMNLKALQDGGVDAVMFSNEFSLPYLTKVDAVTSMAMARVIGELKDEIRIPFGVNVLWDATASCELAVATGAKFVREIFSGVYASDFGLWDTDAGRTVRRRNELGGDDIALMYNILPEASAYLGSRSIEEIARSTVFNCQPDILCVSGATAGSKTDTSILARVKESVRDVPVFANTGVRVETVKEQLGIADGAVVGTAFKRNGDFFDLVDGEKVKEFMDAVFALRK